MGKTRSLADLTQSLRAFQESRVLLTAIELDVFSAVMEGASAQEVAGRLGTDPRATEMLLNALVAIGALLKRGGVFRCTHESQGLAAGRAGLLHTVNLWDTWSSLTACLRTGTAMTSGPRNPDGQADERTRAFIAAMHARAREAAEAFVFGLFPTLGIDRGSHKASHWFFRIHRDARFSKDKTPYKTNFGCALHPAGKKARELGAYLHLQPGNGSFVAGGLYAPEPDQLKKFRLDMEDGPRAFLAILQAPEFRARLALMEGEPLKRVPRGFPEDHPAAELLKLRQIVAWHPITDEQVLSPRFADDVVATVGALRPFLKYLEEAVGLVEPAE